jgi:hypothetical protein
MATERSWQTPRMARAHHAPLSERHFIESNHVPTAVLSAAGDVSTWNWSACTWLGMDVSTHWAAGWSSDIVRRSRCTLSELQRRCGPGPWPGCSWAIRVAFDTRAGMAPGPGVNWALASRSAARARPAPGGLKATRMARRGPGRDNMTPDVGCRRRLQPPRPRPRAWPARPMGTASGRQPERALRVSLPDGPLLPVDPSPIPTKLRLRELSPIATKLRLVGSAPPRQKKLGPGQTDHT